MASLIAVVDSGPLHAAADQERSLAALSAPGPQLGIPAMVVAEVSYFIGTRRGPGTEARFLVSLARLEAEAPIRRNWERIAELVAQDQDLSPSGTDAPVIALTERLGATTVLSLDRRHLQAIRPRHFQALTLLR